MLRQAHFLDLGVENELLYVIHVYYEYTIYKTEYSEKVIS